MPRITVPTRDEAPTESQPILDSVGEQLGFIPNLHRLMSLSPAALTGLIGLQGPLSKTLDLKTRDAISLADSEAKIERAPGTGLPAPRPYPQLARPGWAWTRSGRYWVAYTTGPAPVIVAVFFETANIPGRV